jgi:hypothetical protein
VRVRLERNHIGAERRKTQRVITHVGTHVPANGSVQTTSRSRGVVKKTIEGSFKHFLPGSLVGKEQLQSGIRTRFYLMPGWAGLPLTETSFESPGE